MLHSHDMINKSICSCFTNPEAQVNIKPSVQDAGVQCDLVRCLECAPPRVDACVQCDIECPLFESTPRIDYYSTSESALSDAPHGTDTSSEAYHLSRDNQSGLS